MAQDNSKRDVHMLEGACIVAMDNAKATVEILYAYFENGMKGRNVELAEASIASLLYQVDDNLKDLSDAVNDLVKLAMKGAVKLRAA